eukprot:gene51943-8345_t
MQEFLRKTTGEGLKKKRVSFFACNVNGWHTLIEKKSDSAVNAMHTHMVENILEQGNASKGIVDRFTMFSSALTLAHAAERLCRALERQKKSFLILELA